MRNIKRATGNKTNKKSAGILLYRNREYPEVFLVHPGGPFWSKKDLGAWSIPKGEFTDEAPLEAALREFREETGKALSGDFINLDPVKMKSGKMIFPFALEQNFDEKGIISNTFQIEWPPKSGKLAEFPEIDLGKWFDLHTAKEKINQAQIPIIEQLVSLILK